METGRLMIDPPASGARNMSVDQALLETANESGRVTLRFYRWTEPTLSLGYFQNHADRTSHRASLACPLIRRRTGGGAIVHDQELTYSLCVPSKNRWASENGDLYRQTHFAIIDVLAAAGVTSTLFGDTPPFDVTAIRQTAGETAFSTDSFLCFLRRADGDIVLQGHKIVGSAQRRLKHALLQHGSILLRRSAAAPELAGICDLAGFALPIEELIENIAKAISKSLQINLENGTLSPAEERAAELANSSLFGSADWNLRR